MPEDMIGFPLIVASDTYKWLVPGAVHYTIKHLNRDPVVLCYDDQGLELFCTVSMGKCSSDWTTGVRRYVESIKADWFMLMLEDYYIQHVDEVLLGKAEKLMNSGADKVDLSGDRMKFRHYRHDNDFVVSGQEEKYRSSLQLALWSKKYFLSLCHPGWSAWDFEILGGRKAINDGGTIYGVNRPCIRYVNVMRRGQWYGRCDF